MPSGFTKSKFGTFSSSIISSNILLDLDSRFGVVLGTNGTTATGTTPPAVTFTGTPSKSINWTSAATSIEIDITTLGIVGVAIFQWKLNGVVQQTGQTTASTFLLGTTGITVNFPAGTYATNDVYTTRVCVKSLTDVNVFSANNGVVLNGDGTDTATFRLPYTSSNASFNGVPSLDSTVSGATMQSTTIPSAVAQPITYYTVFITTSLPSDLPVVYCPSPSTQQGRSAAGVWQANCGAAYSTTVPAVNGLVYCQVQVANGAAGICYFNSSTIQAAPGNIGTSTFCGGSILIGYGASWTGSFVRYLAYSALHTTSQVSEMLLTLGSMYGQPSWQ